MRAAVYLYAPVCARAREGAMRRVGRPDDRERVVLELAAWCQVTSVVPPAALPHRPAAEAEPGAGLRFSFCCLSVALVGLFDGYVARAATLRGVAYFRLSSLTHALILEPLLAAPCVLELR